MISMIKRPRAPLFGLGLGLALGVLMNLGMASAAHAQLNDAQAERLMKLSGQWEQLESVATQMREGLLKGMAAGPLYGRKPPRHAAGFKASSVASVSASCKGLS